MDILRAFRIVSLAEAISFLLLLLVAMPLKYGADLPFAVQIMGPIHGTLFLAYVAFVFLTRAQLRWTPVRTLLALVAAVLPVAPIYVERNWIKDVSMATPPA